MEVHEREKMLVRWFLVLETRFGFGRGRGSRDSEEGMEKIVSWCSIG